MFVSGIRRALTFRWRRSGAPDWGVDVGGMCNASMYRSFDEYQVDVLLLKS